MEFVNRHEELDRLEHWWQRMSRSALVWGRRRVGKTALLQRFAEGRRAVFHTGAGRPVAGELTQLSRAIADVVPHRLRDLANRPFMDWDEALEYLADAATDAPLLVVLDEFPEIVARMPELPGVIRAFLDRAEGQTKLRLLLCGSAVRTMQAIQEYRAPLYGRFDLSLPVFPFRPHEAALAMPDLRPDRRALTYGIVGGVPLYLSWWHPRASMQSNLLSLTGMPGAPLLTEGDLILATEVEEGGLGGAVLDALAAGRTKHNEIRDWIGAEPTRTLERLIGLRLVERVVPVTDDPRRTRRRLYRITDNFLRFHLAVVGRYRTQIERGLGDGVVAAIVEGVDDLMGRPWEDAFRAHLVREASGGRFGPDVIDVGPWWDQGGQNQIDAVVLAGRTRTPKVLGEAKWAKTVDGAAIVRGLRRKALALGVQPDDVTYAVCAREAVSNPPAGTFVYTAADLFSAG